MVNFKPTKPMLAGDAPEQIKFPVMASTKLDGIRCMVIDGVAMSRSFKPIPNKHIQKILGSGIYDGLDGELGVGDPYGKNFYLDSVSAVMRIEGEPAFTYFVFDRTDVDPSLPFTARFKSLQERCNLPDNNLKVLPHRLIKTQADLDELEAHELAMGAEGLILRDPNGKYKYGRSSSKEGILLKLKRFMDSEAIITDMIEQMKNDNVAFKDELGRTARSTEKAGMVAQNTLGALKVRDLRTNQEFSIGTGFSAALRQELWDDKDNVIGKIAKYKYFPTGSKDAPRFPVFIGFRDRIDM